MHMGRGESGRLLFWRRRSPKKSLQLTLGGHRDTVGLQQSLARRLRRMVALGHFGTVALLGSEFERRLEESARRRCCPATGTAWQAKREHLGLLPILPQPFDGIIVCT